MHGVDKLLVLVSLLRPSVSSAELALAPTLVSVLSTSPAVAASCNSSSQHCVSSRPTDFRRGGRFYSSCYCSSSMNAIMKELLKLVYSVSQKNPPPEIF